MKRIGEDVAEKLDYVPGVFTVERHIRGKWVCTKCETLVQAPVPAHIIDKGIPTTGLLAQVLVAKYQDHLPAVPPGTHLRACRPGHPAIDAGSWVGQCGVQLQPLVDALKAVMLKSAVLHADETPVAMLKPGNKKTHRAYIWSYCTTPYDALKAVVFDFAEGRGGQHVRGFLGLDANAGKDGWHGKLVCDGLQRLQRLLRVGRDGDCCLAHARRKFHELWVNHGSQVGERALKFFGEIYDIEREVQELQPDEREANTPAALGQGGRRPASMAGAATQAGARGIGHSQGHRLQLEAMKALTRFIDDGELPADNNWVENQIRPIAIGRSNWLFAGSLRAGQRAAAV